jgi:hypothetical protein
MRRAFPALLAMLTLATPCRSAAAQAVGTLQVRVEVVRAARIPLSDSGIREPAPGQPGSAAVGAGAVRGARVPLVDSVAREPAPLRPGSAAVGAGALAELPRMVLAEGTRPLRIVFAPRPGGDDGGAKEPVASSRTTFASRAEAAP